LHDDLPAFESIPRRAEIEQINRDTYRRLMDLVAADWL
jgi:hypothetical protein